jgi:hypothetical protein
VVADIAAGAEINQMTMHDVLRFYLASKAIDLAVAVVILVVVAVVAAASPYSSRRR